MFLGGSLRKPHEGLDAARKSGIAKSAGEQRAEVISRVGIRSICLAAGFVFAAARWAIGVVNEYVIVAGRADDTVHRLAELLMAPLGCVLAACLFPPHGHRPPLREYPLGIKSQSSGSRRCSEYRRNRPDWQLWSVRRRIYAHSQGRQKPKAGWCAFRSRISGTR
jgi:hypothetical protein